MSTLPTSSADEEQDDESMFETDANAGDPGVTFNSTPISGPVINVLRESIKETGIKSGNDFVFRPQTGVSLAGPYPGRVDPSDCSIDLEFDADDAPAPPVSQVRFFLV